MSAQKVKSLKVSAFRGLFVAGAGDISNLDLMKDLAEVIGFIDEHETEFCEIASRNKHSV